MGVCLTPSVLGGRGRGGACRRGGLLPPRRAALLLGAVLRPDLAAPSLWQPGACLRVFISVNGVAGGPRSKSGRAGRKIKPNRGPRRCTRASRAAVFRRRHKRGSQRRRHEAHGSVKTNLARSVDPPPLNHPWVAWITPALNRLPTARRLVAGVSDLRGAYRRSPSQKFHCLPAQLWPRPPLRLGRKARARTCSSVQTDWPAWGAWVMPAKGRRVMRDGI